MSSGSLKDLTKAISTSTSNPTLPLPLPLPDDLLLVIHAYLEKHASYDDADSQRLQEELLAIYQRDILDKPSRLAPFLAILRTLKPGIRGSGRLLQWWEKLSMPVLNKLGEEKGLAIEARNVLLGLLIYEEDEEEELVKDDNATSEAVAESLLATWLAKVNAASTEFDSEAHFVEGQIQLILVAFGKKRPKDFLTTINKFFVKKESRILVLSLLCEFIRHQPPHLHQLLQTPLFDNLLRCLQVDTSTRVISLAMTALIMFLPHIPSSLATHLPALFNIYSRLLFWDRERRASDTSAAIEDSEINEKSPPPPDDKSWAKLSYLLESEDETVPELLHYFTFLYGLYPINFMSYIRKPQRYLRHASFSGADDLDIQPTEIRQRSEPFREVHLLHPNFFMMTIESELTDNNRWMRSEAADVVAECMALFSPGEDGHAHIGRSATQKLEANSDVPEQPLLDQDVVTPYQSRHTSWRNTQSTAVASPEDFKMSGLHRKASQTSQSMPSIADVDSPSLRPAYHHRDRVDSPTLPPQMLASPPHNHLHDMLNSQRERSTRGSIYQSLTNDSVASLALSHTQNQQDSSVHVDAYLQSLSRETIPRSPSLRPTTAADPNVKIAYLHREIQLLKNDLNFERYLKQQHLSHIGQLRRKQIREARVEAETQNLINSNRTLKSKLEEAKRDILQKKTENEKSKSHSRKWEADLSSKLRALREQQKKWNLEREELMRDLQTERDDKDKLRQLVVTSESKELGARQKMQSVEGSLDELEHLRGEVEKLTMSLRTFEAGETEVVKAKENAEAALAQVAMLQTQLASRDAELAKSTDAFEQELYELRTRNGQSGWNRRGNGHSFKNRGITQDMLDSALSASRIRIVEIQKAHNHLLRRYTGLQDSYLDLKEQLDHDHAGEGDEPLLSGGNSSPKPVVGKQMDSYRVDTSTSPPLGDFRRRNNTANDADFDNSLSSSNTFPVRPIKLDTGLKSSTSTPTGPEAQSPVERTRTGAGIFHPFNPQPNAGKKIGADGESLDSHGKEKKKIVPQSDVRIYGRGGVQNIGKKEKEKKDKEKPKDGQGQVVDGKDAKKDKKSVGIRGIRGFV